MVNARHIGLDTPAGGHSTHGAAKAFASAAVWLTVVGLSAGCSHPISAPAANSLTVGGRETLSAQQIDDQSFCQQARQAGITNGALIADNADPITLLGALDQMLPNAPASIHDDFDTFVKLEHGILSSGGTDSPPSLSVDESSARTALTHVQNYLRDTCHIS